MVALKEMSLPSQKILKPAITTKNSVCFNLFSLLKNFIYIPQNSSGIYEKMNAESSRQDEQDKRVRLSISSKLEDRSWRQKVIQEADSHTSFGINFVCVGPGEFGRR